MADNGDFLDSLNSVDSAALPALASNFHFNKLPALCQEEIAAKIVHGMDPEYWPKFALLSSRCYHLFIDAHPKILVKHLTITVDVSGFHLMDPSQKQAHFISRHFGAVDEFIEFLKYRCVVESAHLSLNFAPLESVDNLVKIVPVLKVLLRYIKSFELTARNLNDPQLPVLLVDLLSTLKKCSSLDFMVSRWEADTVIPVLELTSVMTKHSRLMFMRSAKLDDKLLKLLSLKTNSENPLQCLCCFSNTEFTLEGIKEFLMETTFDKNVQLSLTPVNAPRIKVVEMLKTIGNVVDNPSKNAVLLDLNGSQITYLFGIEPVAMVISDWRSKIARFFGGRAAAQQ